MFVFFLGYLDLFRIINRMSFSNFNLELSFTLLGQYNTLLSVIWYWAKNELNCMLNRLSMVYEIWALDHIVFSSKFITNNELCLKLLSSPISENNPWKSGRGRTRISFQSRYYWYWSIPVSILLVLIQTNTNLDCNIFFNPYPSQTNCHSY